VRHDTLPQKKEDRKNRPSSRDIRARWRFANQALLRRFCS
jgi:hypothetical protein